MTDRPVNTYDVYDDEAAAAGYQVTRTRVARPGFVRRISWGSILAGIVVALITLIALNMLGTAIGAAAIDPETDPTPVGRGFTTAAVIWIGVSVLLSLFAGGWVAGRMAGFADHTDGMLHGLITWAVVSLIALFYLTSATGAVIGGVVNTVGQGLSLAGQAIGDVAPEVADAVNLRDNALTTIRDEINTLQAEVDTTVTDGENTDGNLVIAITHLLRQDAQNPDPEVRQSAVDLLVAQTNLTPAEAEQRITQWENDFRAFANDAEETLREASADVADAVAAAAGVAFMMLVLGAFAAGGGGLVGAPDEDTYRETCAVSSTQSVAEAATT